VCVSILGQGWRDDREGDDRNAAQEMFHDFDPPLQFWIGRGISDAGNKTGNLFVLDRENRKPVFGVGQIMIGTDYPFPWNKGPGRPRPVDPGAQRR
jgi:hypothetical protein